MIRYISDEQWEKIIRDNQRQDDMKKWLEWLDYITNGLYVGEHTVRGIPAIIEKKQEELKKEIEK